MNTTNNQTENTSNIGCKPLPRNMRLYTELDSDGNLVSRELTDYECQLEDDVEHLQESLFTISSQYAKIQFHLRQISSATACEKYFLLKELEDMAAQAVDARDCRWGDLPSLHCDSTTLGNVRAKQQKIIFQLRSRLEDLADATGACFQADTTGWSSAYTNQISPLDLIKKDSGKHMPKEKPRERYLSETWSGRPDCQRLNSKLKYVCRGRPKKAQNVERSDRRLVEHKLRPRAVNYHCKELKYENSLTLRKKKEKQM
ncbi:hypothetical protein KR038_011495 [Drosophila bunnanda]|nr:hypothetical protein KR038_011495 [Drosophila bunnanda]